MIDKWITKNIVDRNKIVSGFETAKRALRRFINSHLILIYLSHEWILYEIACYIISVLKSVLYQS